MKMSQNNLGQAQDTVESASKELKLAQAAFLKANERLMSAEQTYVTALQNLNVVVTEVRVKNKVSPLGV